MQSGSEPFELSGVTNGIKADLCCHGHGHGVHCACRPCEVHGMARAGTGRTVACAKREHSWSSFAQLWVCWADEDVGSFEGVYVTSGLVWNLAHSGPYAS